MRKLFSFATILFWLALLFVWQAGRDATVEAPPPPAPAAAGHALAEVSAHAVPADCWMAIDGQVYALAAYLPEHPARACIIEEWCGKEASAAYHTKLRGRPHSSQADKLLARYRIGVLIQP